MLQVRHDSRSNIVHLPLLGSGDVRKIKKLSCRQLEILKLVRFRNEIIADKLNLSEGTVKVHLKNIRKKIGLTGSSRAELLDYAIKCFGVGVVYA